MLVLSVCSLKGGVGKTSVTLGLASAAQTAGISTLVVDLDPQGDATTGLDVAGRVTGTLADLLDQPKARRREVRASTLPSGWTEPERPALDVLVGGPALIRHDAPDARGKQLRRLSRLVERLEDYDLVLLDCPPSLGGLTRAGLAASQRALVVAEPGLFALNAADRGLQVVHDVRGGLNPELQPVGVLLNRFRPHLVEHEFRAGELVAMFGPLVLRQRVPERSAVQQAQGATTPIHRWPGRGAAEAASAFDAVLSRVQRSQHHRAAGGTAAGLA